MLSDLPERRKRLVGCAFIVEAEIEEGTDLEPIKDRLAESIMHMDHVGRVISYHIGTLPDGIAKGNNG